MGASDTGSEASGPGADDSGLVKLDLSSVEALQDALQRGGLLPREKDDAMDSTHGVQAERDLSVARVTHGKGTSRGRLEEEGSQLWRNGGVFKAGRGARGRRKYDDGFDGDDDDPSVHGSSRSLAGSSLHGGAEVLPMRYELALSRRLFRLSRGVTKLRVIRWVDARGEILDGGVLTEDSKTQRGSRGEVFCSFVSPRLKEGRSSSS